MLNKFPRIKVFFALAVFVLHGSFLFADQTQEVNVNGLKVIYRHSPKQVISARFFILGGTANYPLSQQGIESVALNVAINGGTVSMTKNAFKTAEEKIGASMGYSSTFDYSEMNLTCIKPYWNDSWKLFADAIQHPGFRQDDFTLILNKMISSAKQREASPDGALQETAMQKTFSGKNYEKQPDGTESSLGSLNVDAAKNYYQQIAGKSRCYLVVVGDVSLDAVVAKVKATLANLPAGTPAPKAVRTTIDKGGENIVDRDIAVNYLAGIMTAAPLNSNDGIPMMIAMRIMYNRFFVELRTKRSLSYAPAAIYNSNAISSPYSMIYISTDTPKKAISVMVDLINDVKQNGFTESELKNEKETFLTDFLMGAESSSGQSLLIGRWQARGDWKLGENFIDRVNAVTVKDLNRVIDQNSNAIMWTYLGHKDQVMSNDFVQPTIYVNKPY